MAISKQSLRALLAIIAAAACAVAPAHAQSWPQRQVKMILPLGPGAGIDIAARLLGDRLAPRWGQPVVIENRPGGDGVIALTAFTGAKDDHTLLTAPSSAFVHHPWTQAKMPYDQRDVVPIARISTTVVTIVVPASSPFHSLADLVAAARAQPGKLAWATITGFFDFMFEGFQKKANLDIARVPYRDTVQAANDLAEGRIQLMMAAYAITRPHVEAGKLRILAITAHERAAILPNIPAAAEAGFPDLTIEGLAGVFGPPSLASDARERIAGDVRSVLADPVIVARLAATGQIVNPGTPTELAAAIAVQRAQAVAVGERLGIKPAQ